MRQFLAYPPRWLLPLVISPFILLIVAYFGYFFFGSRYSPAVPPPSTQLTVPASATEVQIRELAAAELTSFAFEDYDQRTVFLTAAPVVTIIDFYRSAMQQAGWRAGYEEITPQQSLLGFAWQFGCPVWSAVLKTSPAAAGRSRVQLDIMRGPCY